MAYQSLELGSTADDGTGDTLRAGGDKINDNFSEIYTAIGSGTAIASGISADATTITLSAPTITGVVGGTQTSATITTLTSTTVNPGTLSLAAGSITDSSGTIDFGNENLTTTGNITGAAQFLVANDGTIGSAGDTDAVAISSAGVFAFSATTEASATGTAAVTLAGGLGVAKDIWVGDDIVLDSDSAVIKFGDSQEVELTHVADTGLILKHTATGDGTPVKLTMQTGENALTVGEQLGVIDFQAPGESSGTDAILVAAGIEAVAEEEFSSSSNATKLSFKTASSEAAAEKMSLGSGGQLDVSGSVAAGAFNDNIILNGTNAASANAGDDLVLDGSAASTDVGSRILYEDGSTGNERYLDSVNETDAIETVGKIILDGYGTTTGTGDALLNETGGHLLYNEAPLPLQLGGNEQGDVAFNDGTNWNTLAPGTSGYFLKTQGASADPVWAEPTGGDTWTYKDIQSTATGTSVTFTGFAAGTKHIWVQFLQCETDGDADFEVLIGDSGGIETSNYVSVGGGGYNTGSFRAQVATAHWYTQGTEGHVDTNQTIVGTVQIFRTKGGTTHHWNMISQFGGRHTSTSHIFAMGAGLKELSGELTQLRIELSNNNFDGGNIICHSE